MHCLPLFFLVALTVTLTPGPAFALVVQTALIHGRTCALASIAGNAVAVLSWGALSAAGVSALIAADRLAYDTLRILGAAYLIGLGLRGLWRRHADTGPDVGRVPERRPASRALRRGLVNGLANPKLAVFFVALLPQFLGPGSAMLLPGVLMAAVIVAFDVLVYGAVAVGVAAFAARIRPRLVARVDRVGVAVLLGFGVRLATEAR
ncbi:MAG: LysE family translocator [Actinobacteria bacterium]|nr:LysE family translocator [Actinomycetota bacterium]